MRIDSIWYINSPVYGINNFEWNEKQQPNRQWKIVESNEWQTESEVFDEIMAISLRRLEEGVLLAKQFDNIFIINLINLVNRGWLKRACWNNNENQSSDANTQKKKKWRMLCLCHKHWSCINHQQTPKTLQRRCWTKIIRLTKLCSEFGGALVVDDVDWGWVVEDDEAGLVVEVVVGGAATTAALAVVGFGATDKVVVETALGTTANESLINKDYLNRMKVYGINIWDQKPTMTVQRRWVVR